jgi:hypothetical protein
MLYGILDATRKSQVVVRLENLPVLRKTLFCTRRNLKIRHKVPSEAGVNHFKYIITMALWRVHVLSELNGITCL